VLLGLPLASFSFTFTLSAFSKSLNRLISILGFHLLNVSSQLFPLSANRWKMYENDSWLDHQLTFFFFLSALGSAFFDVSGPFSLPILVMILLL
jgi:hypothetical protein